MSVYDYKMKTLNEEEIDFENFRTNTLLIVNVASKCGLTPQYEGLEKMYREYKDQGLIILGFPCNQFLEQEPGTPEEILTFCKTNYDVTFPIFQKLEVNGPNRHSLYAELTKINDDAGESGDITWNFEKFVIGPGGSIEKRFRPQVTPEDDSLVATVKELVNS
jgi:glutathione peroxidase